MNNQESQMLDRLWEEYISVPAKGNEDEKQKLLQCLWEKMFQVFPGKSDFVNDTMIEILNNSFAYDPLKGSFSHYLCASISKNSKYADIEEKISCFKHTSIDDMDCIDGNADLSETIDDVNSSEKEYIKINKTWIEVCAKIINFKYRLNSNTKIYFVICFTELLAKAAIDDPEFISDSVYEITDAMDEDYWNYFMETPFYDVIGSTDKPVVRSEISTKDGNVISVKWIERHSGSEPFWLKAIVPISFLYEYRSMSVTDDVISDNRKAFTEKILLVVLDKNDFINRYTKKQIKKKDQGHDKTSK